MDEKILAVRDQLQAWIELHSEGVEYSACATLGSYVQAIEIGPFMVWDSEGNSIADDPGLPEDSDEIEDHDLTFEGCVRRFQACIEQFMPFVKPNCCGRLYEGK